MGARKTPKRGRKSQPSAGSGDVPFIRFRFDNETDDLADAEALARNDGADPWEHEAHLDQIQPHSVRIATPDPVNINRRELLVPIQRNGLPLGAFEIHATDWIQRAEVVLEGGGPVWTVMITCFDERDRPRWAKAWNQDGPLL